MNTLAWTLSLWLLLPDYSIWQPTQLCGGITDEQTDTCIYAQFDEFELYKTSNATTTISINIFKHLHVSFKLMQFAFVSQSRTYWNETHPVKTNFDAHNSILLPTEL